jgi:hypothetical protein
MADPKISNQESSYVEPALEVAGKDPLSTDFATTDQSLTICGCCFC